MMALRMAAPEHTVLTFSLLFIVNKGIKIYKKYYNNCFN